MTRITPVSSSSPVTTRSPAVEQFLARVGANALRGRLIFAVDATASRQPMWDTAVHLQAQMFAAIPSGLEIQLVYYRGAECVASRWFSDAAALAVVMRKITCVGGHTQIGKVIRHARTEHQRQKIGGLVLISDACEETPADLYAEAHELGGVPAFMFLEGNNPHVAEVYAEIGRITGGAYARFDAGAAQRLGDLLKAVAAYAGGGVKALAEQKTEASRLLIAQIKR
jgi:hypothetical protein